MNCSAQAEPFRLIVTRGGAFCIYYRALENLMWMRRSPGLLARSPYIGLLAALLAQGALAETIRRGANAWTKGSETVAVTGEALIHTAQLLAEDSTGSFSGGDATEQTRRVLDRLRDVLAAAGSSLPGVVKLNLYVTSADLAEPTLEAVRRRFPGEAPPAISIVQTALPHPGALVGVDAVAAAPDGPSRSRLVLDPNPAVAAGRSAARFARLTPGPRVYISGQAARESNLRLATLAALNLLKGNLAFLGLSLSDAVQVKAFLRPMSEAPAVAKSIDEFFGGKTPPLVFVEWTNAEPIEIELIAAASSGETPSKSLRYLTPPGEKASPVFCRIVRVEHPTTVFFSAMKGDGPDGANQIRDAFERLRSAAARAGTDFHHLVKATYYVTTDDVGVQLTEIRRTLYDPERPPAASKATVRGTGADAGLFTMDMIGVPAAQAANP